MSTEKSETAKDQNEQSQKSENKEYTPRKANRSAYTKHVLRYAIAGLSIVSFFTTSAGLKDIVPSNDKIIPYLISFGIQVLVLIVGTGLFRILKSIYKINQKKLIKGIVVLSVLIPYISAVIFSSFFSYVFLSNEAYNNVKESDYNIEIDNFLNKEIGNLDRLNNAAGRLILSHVQTYVPGFKDTLNQFAQNADAAISVKKNNLILNTNDSIDQSVYFNAQNTIDRVGASDAQTESLNTIEKTINDIADNYAFLYQKYYTDFNYFVNTNYEDIIDSLDLKIESMQEIIELLEDSQNALKNVSDINSKFSGLINLSKLPILEKYRNLISSYKNLLAAYREVQTSKKTQYANIDLNEIYHIIYSTVNINDSNSEDGDDYLDNTIKTLQNLIGAYLETTNTEEINNSVLQNLSACIVFLGEYQSYKQLSENIEEFKTNVLTQTYVIQYSNINAEQTNPLNENAEKDTTNTNGQSLNNGIEINYVSRIKWNEIRRKNLGEFISLVKELPSFETILNGSDKAQKEIDAYIQLLNDNINYQTETIQKAYQISRQDLENISKIEQAFNYFKSDYIFMALYCFLVSLFLDLSAFFVGLYFYYTDTKLKDDNSLT